MKEQLLSVNDICNYFGMKRDTIYKWIDTEELPAYRLGRRWRFKKKEVDRWLRKSLVNKSQ